MNLGTRGGFDRAVALLAAQLRRATGRADVDGARGDRRPRRRLGSHHRRRAAPPGLRGDGRRGRATAIVPGASRPVQRRRAGGGRRHPHRRPARTAAGDRRRVQRRRPPRRRPRDQLPGQLRPRRVRRRIEGFGEEARRIVAAGLEEGLGRDDIAEALEAGRPRALVDRARSTGRRSPPRSSRRAAPTRR